MTRGSFQRPPGMLCVTSAIREWSWGRAQFGHNFTLENMPLEAASGKASLETAAGQLEAPPPPLTVLLVSQGSRCKKKAHGAL